MLVGGIQQYKKELAQAGINPYANVSLTEDQINAFKVVYDEGGIKKAREAFNMLGDEAVEVLAHMAEHGSTATQAITELGESAK